LRPELAALQSGQDERLLIRELAHNAAVAWKRSAYLDFLSRATRFLDSALRLLTAEHLSEPLAGTAVTPGERRMAIQGLRLATPASDPGAAGPEQVILIRVRDLLREGFDLSELADLGFDLGIRPDSIPGNTIAAKSRELVGYTERRGQLPALVAHARRQRPHLSWPDESALLGDASRQWRDVVSILERLQRLAILRDESILGYGTAGASADIVLRRFYGSEPDNRNPVEAMTIVCQALGIATANRFRTVRDIIISELGNQGAS
jgi:hypothetical protein